MFLKRLTGWMKRIPNRMQRTSRATPKRLILPAGRWGRRVGWRCRWGSVAPTVSAMPLGRGKTRSVGAFRAVPAPVACRVVAALCGPVPGRFGAVARSGRRAVYRVEQQANRRAEVGYSRHIGKGY